MTITMFLELYLSGNLKHMQFGIMKYYRKNLHDMFGL